MKKVILSAAIVIATLATTSTTRAQAPAAKEENTVLKNVKNISAIEVHGYVQVYLTSGRTDKATVYDNYYGKNALVQEENGVLRITSYNTKKMVVWVTVSNLTKVSAYDNAEVSSFGKFAALDLNIDLHNNALAKLDVDAINANLNLNDHAIADLSGRIENGTVSRDRFTYASTENLAFASFTEKLNRPARHFHHSEMNLI